MASQLKEAGLIKSPSLVTGRRGGSDFMADRKGLEPMLRRQSPGIRSISSSYSTHRAMLLVGTTHSPHEPCGATLYSDCLAPVTSVEMLPGSRSNLQVPASQEQVVSVFLSSSEVSFVFRRLTQQNVTPVRSLKYTSEPVLATNTNPGKQGSFPCHCSDSCCKSRPWRPLATRLHP